MALTAVRIADSLGFKVPGDLSILGFADRETARYGNPPLTTISQPFVELGKVAVRGLLEAAGRLERKEDPRIREALLPNRLVVRESTAAPPVSGA